MAIRASNKLQGDIPGGDLVRPRARSLEKVRDAGSRSSNVDATAYVRREAAPLRRPAVSTLDLDDGVKVNYGKFGDLLAEVTAVHGKRPKVEVRA